MIGRIERERDKGKEDQIKVKVKSRRSALCMTPPCVYIKTCTKLTTVEDLKASMGRLYTTIGYNDSLILLNYTW